MKLLMLLLIPLWLIGCGEAGEKYVTYGWVVERGDRTPDQIQRDFNAMGQHGWKWAADDDLEKSGYYVYFIKRMRPSEARNHRGATWKAMNNRLDAPK